MSYNGWANRETWNVMLWIDNDEPLYRCACEFVANRGGDVNNAYQDFIYGMDMQNDSTPDGIAWISDELDDPALDEALMELE